MDDDGEIPRNPSWLKLDIEALNSERKQKVGDRFTKQSAHIKSPRIRNAAVENSRLQYYMHYQAEASLKAKSPAAKTLVYSESPEKLAASQDSVSKLRDAATLAAAVFSEKDAKDREKKLRLMQSALKGPSPGKSPRMQRSPDKMSQSATTTPRLPSSPQSSSRSPRVSMLTTGNSTGHQHVQRNMNQELDAAATGDLEKNRRESSIRPKKPIHLGPMERLSVFFAILRYGQVLRQSFHAQLEQQEARKRMQFHAAALVYRLVRRYVHDFFKRKYTLSDSAHYSLVYRVRRYRKMRQIERVKVWLTEYPKLIKRDLVTVVTDYVRRIKLIQRFARSARAVRRARILMLKLHWEKIERRFRNQLAEHEKARVDHLKAEEFSKLLALNSAKEAARQAKDNTTKAKTVQQRWSDRAGLVNLLCDRMEEVQSGFAVNKRYMDNCFPPEELARLRGQSLDGEELGAESLAEASCASVDASEVADGPTRSEVFVATYLDDNKGRYDGDLTAREYVLADYTSLVTERVHSKERNAIILRTLHAKKLQHLENIAAAKQQSTGISSGEVVDHDVVNKYLGSDSYLPYVTALLLSPAEKWSARNQRSKTKGSCGGGSQSATRKAGAEALARYRRELAKKKKHDQAMHYRFNSADVIRTAERKARRQHTGDLAKDAEIDLEQLHANVVIDPFRLLKATNLGKTWKELVHDAVQTQIITSNQQKMRAALIKAEKSK